MANKVRFDYSKASKFINAHEVEYMSELAVAAREKLVSKSGAGNDFLGWIALPVDLIKKNLRAFKRRQQRFRAIQKYFL